MFILIFFQDMRKICYILPEPARLHLQIKNGWGEKDREGHNKQGILKICAKWFYLMAKLWQLRPPISGIFLNKCLRSDIYWLHDNVFNFYLCKYFTWELAIGKQNRFCYFYSPKLKNSIRVLVNLDT